MAAIGEELKALLEAYIDEDLFVERLRDVLRSTSVDVKYNLLISVRGVKNSTDNGVYRAAWSNDKETLKLMLADFTSAHKFEVVRIQDGSNWTSVHAAARHGYADIVVQLLSHLSCTQRYRILKVESEAYKETALHKAAKGKHLDFIQIALSSVTPQQKNDLLNIRNDEKKTIAGLVKLPELHFASSALTSQELRDTRKETGTLKTDMTKQSKDMNRLTESNVRLTQKCERLEREGIRQTEELRAANQKIADLERDKVQQDRELRRLGERQIEMERMIAELDRVLRQPICIGPEMDQEHED